MGKIVLYIVLLLAVVKLDAQDERAKAFNNQLPISIGFSYGKYYSYRWLRDNPRYSLTNPNITDDVEFMNLRNQYESAAMTSSFSIRLDYILNDYFKVHTGVHFSSVGENVNTTSIGFRDDDATPIEISHLGEDLKNIELVFDIIYEPLTTTLLVQADQHHIKTLNGLDMNLEQAVLAFNYANSFIEDNSRTASFMKEVS